MARMKGLSEWTIVIRHAARNALLPVATAFALGIGVLGRRQCGDRDGVLLARPRPHAGDAVQASDYPLAQGAFLLDRARCWW